MDEVLSLLDRQVAALQAQVSAADFLVSVEPMLRALRAEPRLAVHLQDLQDEALDRIRVFEGVDAELVPVLVDLRNRLVVLDPASDDSDRQPAKYPKVDPSWAFSLAHFDAVAARPPAPLNYRGEGTRSEELLRILQSKANVVQRRIQNAAPDATGLRRRRTGTTGPWSCRAPMHDGRMHLAGSSSRCACRPVWH